MTNLERMDELIMKGHRPFIVYDVETTGAMNGNDNHITQMALVSYAYNQDTKSYELQDNIFMLRKASEGMIENVRKQEEPTKENVIKKLGEEYLYKQKSDLNNQIKKTERALAKAEKKGDTAEVDKLKDTLTKQKEELVNLSEETKENPDKFLKTPEFDAYVNENFDKQMQALQQADRVDAILTYQGLNPKEYESGKVGLTLGEMQIGITEFLNKYRKDDTVFVNNGTYFANHYMQKDGLTFGKVDKEQVIDLVQAERSMKGGGSRWTSDIGTFAAQYKQDTGIEIKTFDAFTKALCMGEMTGKATDIAIVRTSENYLKSKVAETAMLRDEDYVMSLERASRMEWFHGDEFMVDMADYHFDSLEYVDFGNDRRYVDLDKMFEMNDNFEVTLEGDKTPIKTWEELEAKIKALNAEISPELLDKIHDKFEEIQKDAEENRREQEEARRQQEEARLEEEARQREAEERQKEEEEKQKEEAKKEAEDEAKKSEAMKMQSRLGLLMAAHAENLALMQSVFEAQKALETKRKEIIQTNVNRFKTEMAPFLQNLGDTAKMMSQYGVPIASESSYSITKTDKEGNHVRLQLQNNGEAGLSISPENITDKPGTKMNLYVSPSGHCTLQYNFSDNPELLKTLITINKELPALQISLMKEINETIQKSMTEQTKQFESLKHDMESIEEMDEMEMV